MEIKRINKSNKHHASESFDPAFTLAAASSSLKDPLRRHIVLKIPPALLMRFQGVSNSAIYQRMIRASDYGSQKANEQHALAPCSGLSGDHSQ